jgi:head-tail adaptor
MRAPVPARRVVLERAVTTPDGAGGFATAWEVVCVHWAEFRLGAGRARQGAEAVPLGAVDWRLYLRALPVGHLARPEPGMRFREGARVFPVLAVAEDDARGRWMVCFTREEVPG